MTVQEMFYVVSPPQNADLFASDELDVQMSGPHLAYDDAVKAGYDLLDAGKVGDYFVIEKSYVRVEDEG